MSETDEGTKTEAGIAGENAFFSTGKRRKTTTLQPFLQEKGKNAVRFQPFRMENTPIRPKTIYLQEILDKAS